MLAKAIVPPRFEDRAEAVSHDTEHPRSPAGAVAEEGTQYNQQQRADFPPRPHNDADHTPVRSDTSCSGAMRLGDARLPGLSLPDSTGPTTQSRSRRCRWWLAPTRRAWSNATPVISAPAARSLRRQCDASGCRRVACRGGCREPAGVHLRASDAGTRALRGQIASVLRLTRRCITAISRPAP